MYRRTVRFACLLIGLLATAGLSYRAFEDEQALTSARHAAVAADQTVNETAELLLDLRASLHAYVAPGQGLPFWGKRAQEGIDSLRQRIIALDEIVAPRGGSLAQSLDAVDQLAAAERRARTYVSRDEMQLAGDAIFTEIRDVLAATTSDIQTLRAGFKREHEDQAAAIRREQTMLAGGALAMWIVIALLLVPIEARAALEDPAQWRNELKETLKKPLPVETPKVLDPVPAPAPALPAVSIGELRTVSEICSDLSALADTGALSGALARVNAVMNATGLIVWVASNDGSSLSPVATHGFDPNMVNRIGRIPRDSANVTAAAFRESAPKVSPPTATSPAALAVPMYGPTGPTGVLSVELKAGQNAEEATVALAAIVAAQLATLAMPIPAPAEAQPAPAPVVEEEHKRAAM
jgi:hypothetical protein